MKQKWFKLLFFDLPFIAFVVLFTVVTVLYLPEPGAATNVFWQYYNSHIVYLALPLMIYCLFFILFTVINIQMAARYPHPAQRRTGRRIVKYAFALACLLVVSFPVSFLTTYLYAFGQINYHILAYNNGHTDKNILTSPQAIADAVSGTDRLSLTTISPDNYKKDVLMLYMKQKNGFYENIVLSGFPNALYKRSYLPYSSIILINGNQLVISSMNERDLAILSPALGKAIIDTSLENSYRKSPADITILERDEYIALRKRHIKNQVHKLDDVLGKVDDSIASVSGFIAANQQSIITNQRLRETAAAKRETVTCKTPAKCETARKKYEKAMKQAEDNIAKATTALEKNQKVLGTSVTNKNSLLQTRDDIAVTEAYTVNELGVFIPGNKINITLDNNPSRMYDAYLSTLTHEYFHYISYAGEDKKLDHFFEEALTEYFARRAVTNYTGKTPDIGYPIGVRIITEMTQKIPEKKLVDIYFSKDQKALTALLNKTYGSTFYSQNSGVFNTLSYLPFEESLKLANLLMVQIGGNYLTPDDFPRNIKGLSALH